MYTRRRRLLLGTDGAHTRMQSCRHKRNVALNSLPSFFFVIFYRNAAMSKSKYDRSMRDRRKRRIIIENWDKKDKNINNEQESIDVNKTSNFPDNLSIDEFFSWIHTFVYIGKKNEAKKREKAAIGISMSGNFSSSQLRG